MLSLCSNVRFSACSHFQNLIMFSICFWLVVKRHFQKVGPETRECWWDSRPKTQYPSSRWDLGPKTREPKGRTRAPRPGTLKVEFLKFFSVFSEAWPLWKNSSALCIYVYFVCFTLPYHEAYTLLIFYHLN